MLKSVRMEKLAIIGLKDDLNDVVKRLYDLGCMHVSDVTKKLSEKEWQDLISACAPLQRSDQISSMLLKLHGIFTLLPRPASFNPAAVDTRDEKSHEELVKEYDALIADVEPLVSEKIKKMEKLKAREKESEERTKMLQPLLNLPLPLSDLQGYTSVNVHVGLVPNERVTVFKDAPLFDAVFAYAESKNEQIIILFSKKGAEEEAAKLLRENEFRELAIPPVSGTAAEELKNIEKERQKLGQEGEELNKELAGIAEKYHSSIYNLAVLLQRESEKTMAPVKFGSGKNYFAAFGWVPKAKVDEVKNTFGDKKDILIEVVAHDEEPPIKLENPNLAKPFEGVTELMSLPKYHEIDPSSIMLLTFPLFFGLMLGDVAYGIVIYLFIRFGGMQKLCNAIGLGNIPPNSRLSKILMYCALSSIAFGVLFGEFFGFELYGEHSIIGLYNVHGFNRIESVVPLLIISMTIGAFHIIFGYVLGYINERAEGKSFKEASGKIGWVLTSIGFYLIILGLFNAIELGTAGMLGAAFIVVGALTTIKSEGALSVIEITMPLSNLFSYSRLMAFGLSSIAIATVANKILAMGGGGLSGGMVIALFGAVMLHILNTLLALLPMFLQSLRLHYVEFFIKFYEGGGESYKPFGGK